MTGAAIAICVVFAFGVIVWAQWPVWRRVRDAGDALDHDRRDPDGGVDDWGWE